MGIYSKVKAQIGTRDVAEHFGFKVNRKGMMCCPFHDDSVPSMKIDQNFICFGCREKGDVIDFTSKLLGLSRYEAAETLIKEMGLTITGRSGTRKKRCNQRRISRKQIEHQCFMQAVQRSISVLSEYHRLLNTWAAEYSPRSMTEDFHPRFIEALEKREYIGYLLDLLSDGSEEEKAMVIIEKGKEINDLEKRIRSFEPGDGECSSPSSDCTSAGNDNRSRERAS